MKRLKIFGVFFFLFILLTSCRVRDIPEEIHYGVDVCEFCKMTIVDAKWGGEIITKKGKVYKFDVVECMIAYALNALKPENISSYWTINFTIPKSFIEAEKAIYIRTFQFRSPMGLNALALKSLEDTSKLNLTLDFDILTWEELIAKVKDEILH